MSNINLIKKDNKVVVSSREIAENFEKEHSKVLRAIRNLECSKEFNEANFGLVEYEDKKGEKRTEYLMTRDGFTLLAMGFTGKKAMQFKEAYIEAFNKMEGTLRNIDRNAVQNQTLEIKKKNADARLKNAKIKEAQFLLSVADKYRDILSEQSVELITINAIETINGKNTIQRPKLPSKKYYSATDIGDEIGLTANMIGRIAKSNNLKTDEYGISILDKAKSCDKQVPNFKYNEKGKQKLLEIINKNKLV